MNRKITIEAPLSQRQALMTEVWKRLKLPRDRKKKNIPEDFNTAHEEVNVLLRGLFGEVRRRYMEVFIEQLDASEGMIFLLHVATTREKVRALCSTYLTYPNLF